MRLHYMPIDEWKAKALEGSPPEDVMLCKDHIDAEIKVLATERQIRMTLSTGAVDRDNDTIAVDGWDLKNFKKNPVILWAHNYSQLPIGKASRISVEDGRLSATIHFPEPDIHPFADTVFQLMKGGFLHASSVGFRRKESVFNEERRGFDFRKQELLEASIVPVPANPQALVEARHALGGDVLQPLIAWCEEALDTWHGEKGLWVPRSQLAEAITALRGEKAAPVTVLDNISDNGSPESIFVDGVSFVCGLKGEQLAALLNRLIESRVNDNRTRADIIESMGAAAGIAPGTVNQILRGEINCPPLQRLQGFARALNTSVGRLRTAAEADGCEYGQRDIEGFELKEPLLAQLLHDATDADLADIKDVCDALMAKRHPEEIEGDVSDELDQFLASVFHGSRDDDGAPPSLADLDADTLKGVLAPVLGELVTEAFKSQITAISGRLVD